MNEINDEAIKAAWLQVGSADEWSELGITIRHVVRAIIEKDRAQRQAQPELYVCARECDRCGHTGINDDSDTQSACNNCDWAGDTPAQDQCPGCGQDGTMSAACPKCTGRYRLLAEVDLPIEAQRQAEQEPAFYAHDETARDFAKGWQGEMRVTTNGGGQYNTPLYTAAPPPAHIGEPTDMVAPPAQVPLDMILHCPKCHLQHIDAPDERTPEWKNESHRSHLCHGCGHIWRPADVPTNGVAAIKTMGKADSPPAQVPLTVDLPERVVDTVAQSMGLSGPFTQDFYDFAQALMHEVLARVPSR